MKYFVEVRVIARKHEPKETADRATLAEYKSREDARLFALQIVQKTKLQRRIKSWKR